MAQECPPLNNLTRNPDLVLIGNTGIPRLSTYSRTVGTRVNLTCVSEFRLQPNNPQLVCLNSLEWDKSNPVCTNAPLPATTTAAPGGLSDDQTLIIAITGGIGGFIFLILLVLIAAICRMQRRAQKRRKVLENPPPPPRTEVTSAGSMYALDNRGVSGYEKAYPLYPPSYSSRDIDQDKLGYGRNPIALPPTSSVHNAYTNRGYDRADESQFLSPRSREEYSYRERRRPDDDVATGPHGYPETRIPDESHEIPRSREEILETLARERLDQLQHDRARFQSLDAVYDPSRADGRRVRGARAGEAKVRAERTLQYVEEHSSGSATPSFGGPRDLPGVHQGALTRQGPGGYDGTGPTRYLDDYREHDRIRGNIEDQRQQQQLYPADYRVPLDPRVAGEDYGSYAGGPIERAYDSNDRTGYGPRIFPRSEDIWRPQTKTHYTEKRRR